MNLSLTIRPEIFLDYAPITPIHELASQRSNQADLIALIRQSNRYIPELI